MSDRKLSIGLVGCGNISGIYLKNLTGNMKGAEITKCADLEFERAKAAAEQQDENGNERYPALEATVIDDIYADDSIDLILNLTNPQAHYPVAMKALENGKHVYGEKPLSVTMEEGKKLLSFAAERGLRVGSAPDTFLGGAHQTVRKLIDDGWIGRVVSATAYMCGHGHESWHPAPEFYYKTGGGPMFDMGPYYLTALVNMLGPANTVCGMTGKAYETRTITSKPKYGKKIEVEVPTHLAGQVGFANGAIANVIMSFDIWKANLPFIEVHGTEGSLSIPDPNGFGGEVRIRRGDAADEWQSVPLSHGYTENSRGLGVADMAHAIANDRVHRASGELGLHVLEIMHAFHVSAHERRFIDLETGCEKPAALPMNLLPGYVC